MTAPASSSAQAAQAGLALVVAREVAALWPAVDLQQLERDLPRLSAAVAQLTLRYGLVSAAMAAAFYRQQRRQAGIAGRLTITAAETAPVEQVAAAVGWATRRLRNPEPDSGSALTMLQGAAEKMVLDVGRNTIVDTTHRDPKAKGWARIPEASACFFCALLCIRGAVYKSGTVTFRSHDHCRCHAEPVFTAYEPSAQIREWQQLYQAKTTLGNSKRTRAEWRQAFTEAYGQ